MEKIKIYYDKETGYLCNRYPKDIEGKKDTPFIEIDEEEANKTYCVEYGKFWAVRDNKLVKVDDVEVINSQEYKNMLKENEIDSLKQLKGNGYDRSNIKAQIKAMGYDLQYNGSVSGLPSNIKVVLSCISEDILPATIIGKLHDEFKIEDRVAA